MSGGVNGADEKLPVILSLGAGVQSSTLALMAARGEVGPMPAAAIFADTRGEPAAVYRWLDWLETQLPFPVLRAARGDLAADSTRLRTSKRSGNTYLSPSLPVYIVTDKGPALMGRQCTMTYKIEVVRRAGRGLMERLGAERCVQWIGISTDEAARMKDSPHPRFINAWPLIDLRMSRGDCLRWMEKNGYPQPPRSACVYCPYHGEAEWIRLKTEDPASFARAVEYERQLSDAVSRATALKASAAYLHPSCVPLDRVPFDGAKQRNLFNNECEGMCGV